MCVFVCVCWSVIWLRFVARVLEKTACAYATFVQSMPASVSVQEWIVARELRKAVCAYATLV